MLHHALIQKAPILCRLYLSLYLAPSLSSTHPEDFVFNYPWASTRWPTIHLEQPHSQAEGVQGGLQGV
jgi:hypothetical protein